MHRRPLTLEPLRVGFTRLAAPFGRRKLDRMLADGLPAAFEPALRYLFTSQAAPEDQPVIEKMEAIRAEVAANPTIFRTSLRPGVVVTRTGPELAYHSSVTPQWGMALYLCARAFQARYILELGSCVGISGGYLASSPFCEKLVTIEGSPVLAPLARDNLRRVASQAVLLHGLFDDVLDELLPRLAEKIDLAYIDGHHEYEPTLRYFRRLEPHFKPGSLVVFDDIHWSPGMLQAWKELRVHAHFTYTLDVGRFGLCLWDPQATRTQYYDLSRHTGWLRTVVGR